MKNKKRILICLIIGILIITGTILFLLFHNKEKVVISDKTIFIYMCGSNLETRKGLAGKNIDEILSAEVGDNVSIVIQTGGSQEWKSHDIKNDKIQRYEVKDGKLELVKTIKNSNMGEADTLTDFLVWGQNKYQSEHYMLIIWDHGAGPIDGVAFDENYDFDALDLLELKSALKNANLKKKFDIIGFDACLMASIETAQAIQDYANYMIASEEIEPSGGWNYKTVVESYSKIDELPEVGKQICDSYMQKCIDSGKESYPTLSVFDLSYTNDVLKQFDEVAEMINNDILDSKNSYFTEAVHSAEKFGGGDLYKSSANMIDILDYLSETSKYISLNYVDMYMLLDGQFVTYSVHNENRKVSGVSFFYPEVYNKEDIEKYLKLNVSKNYNKLLKDVFLNVPEKTLELSDKGSKSSDGSFSITLSSDGSQYLNSINYAFMTTDKEDKKHILFIDNDIKKDWDNLVFKSNYKGKTLALNNNRLFYRVVTKTPEFISYIAPIKLNGEKTNLNFVYVIEDEEKNKGYYYIIGTSKGFDENGLLDNDIIPLKKGDKIQVITDVLIDKENVENYGEEFVINDSGKISENNLDMNKYQYVFILSDIFGNTFTSNIATFENNKITNIEKSNLKF